MKHNYANPYVASAAWKKSLLVLKVTTILLAAASMPAAATTYSLETEYGFVRGHSRCHGQS
jgi:hypothetical protein